MEEKELIYNVDPLKISRVSESIRDLYNTIIEVLLDDRKSIAIEFDGEIFNFSYPTIKDDQIEMRLNAQRVASYIIKEDLSYLLKMIDQDSLNDNEIFKYTWPFTKFTDPRDFELEKITTSSVEVIADDNKSRGLNYDAYQVKMQDPQLIFGEEDVEQN